MGGKHEMWVGECMSGWEDACVIGWESEMLELVGGWVNELVSG